MSSVREYVSQVTERSRRIAQLTLHEEIAAGIVDIGPPTKHAPITEDVRDKRDPKVLGEVVIGLVTHRSDIGLATQAQDMIAKLRIHIRDYKSDDSLGKETVRVRRAELHARAAEGDKFAISMLTTGEPGDSDE